MGFRTVFHGPLQCSDGGISRCLKISIAVAQKRSLGWRKKFLSDLLIEAVSEIDQEQRSELGENGA